MNRRVVTSLAGACALGVLSCHLLLGLDYPEPDPAEEPQGNDAGDAVDPCVHATVPERPATDDDPTTSKDYWFAVEHFDFLPRTDAGEPFAFDLDHACTCQRDLFDGAPTCETPAGSGPRRVCDFDGGVDDSIASLVGKLGIPGVNPAAPINELIAQGSQTALIYVGGYNGKANDGDVRIAAIASIGLFSNLGCGEVPRPDVDPGDGGTEHKPTWDGCDHWTAMKGHVVHTPSPAAVPAAQGYVTDHVLVLPSAGGVGLSLLGRDVIPYDGIAVATLTPEGESFALDGVFAGRIPFENVVSLIGLTKAGSPNGLVALCQTEFWPSVGPVLCGARDIMASASRDRTGAICDGTSGSFGFHARPALIDPNEYDVPLDAGACPPIECP